LHIQYSILSILNTLFFKICKDTLYFCVYKKTSFQKKTKELAKVVIDLLLPYKNFVSSITSDNGKEFVKHKKIAKNIVD